MTKDRFKYVVRETVVVAFGSFLFAMALNMFLLPSKVVLGGMTGIATVLNIFFGTPVGLTIIILNIPLVIANTCFFGKDFLRRTVIGVIATSAAADILLIFPITDTDPLLCSILGGAAMGAATGILLSSGYTTGGTDLVACLLRLKWRSVSTGTVVMLCDFLIIGAAAIFTRNYGGIFYSVICTWTSGRVLDVMLSGANRAGQAFIVSERSSEVVKCIFERLDRGVTVIDAVGGYTGEGKKIIMCAMPKRELYFLKQVVKECDPNAFTVIADAAEVTGNGFMSKAAGESLSEKKRGKIQS